MANIKEDEQQDLLLERQTRELTEEEFLQAAQVARNESDAEQQLAAALLTEHDQEENAIELSSNLGAPDLRVGSVFELHELSGSTMEDINLYLNQESRKRYKKDPQELSDVEYREILDDKKGFQKWLAARWVDQYVQARKDEARQAAGERTKDVYQRGGRAIRGRTIYIEDAHPLGEHYRRQKGTLQEAHSQLWRDVDERKKRLRQELQEMAAKDEESLKQFEIAIAASSLPEETQASMIRQFQEQLSSHRQEKERSVTEENRVFQEEAQKRLEQRSAELAQTKRELVARIRGGTKREMVLSADRWGKVIGAMVRDNPRLVKKDEASGATSLNPDALSIQDRQRLIEHLDKEVERVLRASQSTGEASLRSANLEAIIASPAEQEIARWYLTEMLAKAKAATSYRRKDILRRHQAVYDFLLGKGIGSPAAEKEAMTMYQEANMDLQTTIGRVKFSGTWRDHNLAQDMRDVILFRLEKKFGADDLFSAMSKTVDDALTHGLDHQGVRNIIYTVLWATNRWSGYTIETIRRIILEACNAKKEVAWHGNRDSLASIVQDTYIDSAPKSALANASFGQIELNARQWARTDKEGVYRWLQRIVDDIKSKMQSEMACAQKHYAQASIQEVSAYAAGIVEAAKRVQERYQPKVQQLAQLADSIAAL